MFCIKMKQNQYPIKQLKGFKEFKNVPARLWPNDYSLLEIAVFCCFDGHEIVSEARECLPHCVSKTISKHLLPLNHQFAHVLS